MVTFPKELPRPSKHRWYSCRRRQATAEKVILLRGWPGQEAEGLAWSGSYSGWKDMNLGHSQLRHFTGCEKGANSFGDCLGGQMLGTISLLTGRDSGWIVFSGMGGQVTADGLVL